MKQRTRTAKYRDPDEGNLQAARRILHTRDRYDNERERFVIDWAEKVLARLEPNPEKQ